jgi:hypothetical protein
MLEMQTVGALGLPFSLAGVLCVLRTESERLAEIIAGSAESSLGAVRCELHVEVCRGDESPVGTAHFRGMHHVVVASFGAANVFVFDLRRCLVTAKVSEAVARDVEFWQRTLLPIMAGVLGSAIGVLPLHSACLARAGQGLLVAGGSGAGKSTLALAMAIRKFDYISDDWTYCTVNGGALTAHGTAARLKLLPDAVRHFTVLNEHDVQLSMNGEPAYEVRADEVFGARVKTECTPRLLVFLQRMESARSRFVRLDSEAARFYIEANVERLPEQMAEAEQVRSALMDRVAALPCWRFECGGTPEQIAQELEAFFDQQQVGWAA